MKKLLQFLSLGFLSAGTVFAGGAVLREWSRVSGVDLMHGLSASSLFGVIDNSAATSAQNAFGAQGNSLAVGSSQTPGTSLPSVTGLPAVGVSSGVGTAGSLNGADVAHLVLIGKTLEQSVTSQQWISLLSALDQSTPTAAIRDIDSLLTQDLNPADLQWITQHFSGPASFNNTDVQLLEEAIHELQLTLTPGEQGLLQQEMSKVIRQR